jgi:hypothetical protein
MRREKSNKFEQKLYRVSASAKQQSRLRFPNASLSGKSSWEGSRSSAWDVAVSASERKIWMRNLKKFLFVDPPNNPKNVTQSRVKEVAA